MMNDAKRTPINELPYSAGLMSQSFWFVEFKNLVRLIREGCSAEEIRDACICENLFGLPNEYRTKRVFGYLSGRATMLDDDGMDLMLQSDTGTQKLVNLTAMIRGDRLLFEFLYEVYRDKVILGADMLTKEDLAIFFHQKEGQSEIVSGWNEGTKKHLSTSFLKFSAEANLLRMDGRKYFITLPIISDPLRDYLVASKDTAILAAISGGVSQ